MPDISLPELLATVAPCEQGAAEQSFRVQSIPGFEAHYVGRNSAGQPSLLLGSGPGAFHAPVRLALIDARFGSRHRIHPVEGGEREELLSVVTCTSGDVQAQTYFLHLCSTILRIVGPKPALHDIVRVVQRLVDLFRHLSRPPTRSLNGLLGELFLIASSRDVRVTIAPDGHGDFCAAIESRPKVEVSFQEGSPVAGTHVVHGGYEPDILRGLFNARHPQGGGVWPTIKDSNGAVWRIRYANDTFWEQTKWLERDPESAGWQFDPDPLGAPGEAFAEPWYLSYTPATPDYLKHWLTQSWSLGDAKADCPWSRDHFDWGEPDARYDRDLPPLHALNFPNFSHATWVERCLHNGLIEEALQATVIKLAHQTASLQRDWFSARDAHAQGLLNRWNTPHVEKDWRSAGFAACHLVRQRGLHGLPQTGPPCGLQGAYCAFTNGPESFSLRLARG